MSFQELNLFIPRKDRLATAAAIASSCGIDGHHLDEALRDNFLAIERWANARGVSVAVRNSSNAQTIIGTTSALNNVTASFTTVSWDYNNLALPASNQLNLVANGVWFVSAGGQFTNIPASTAVVLDIQLMGIANNARDHTHPVVNGGYNNVSLATVVQVSTAPNPISLRAIVQGTTGTCNFALWEFTATRLFGLPSKVQ